MKSIIKQKFYYLSIFLTIFLFIPQKSLALDSLSVSPSLIEKEIFQEEQNLTIDLKISNNSLDSKQVQLKINSNTNSDFDLSANISTNFTEINLAANSSQTLPYQINLTNLSSAKTYSANIEIKEKDKRFRILVPIVITIKDHQGSPLDNNINKTNTSITIEENLKNIIFSTTLANNSEIVKKYNINHKLLDKNGNLISNSQLYRPVLPQEKASLSFQLKPQKKNIFILPQKLSLKTEITDQDTNVLNFSQSFFYYNYFYSMVLLLLIFLSAIVIIKYFQAQKLRLVKIMAIYLIFFLLLIILNKYWIRIGFIAADQMATVQVSAIVAVNLEVEEIGNILYVSTNSYGYKIIYDTGQIIERPAPVYRQENIIPEGVNSYFVQTI